MSAIETTARRAAQTIAATVVGDPDRVILGLDDIPAGTDFFKDLQVCGPTIYILDAIRTNSDPVNCMRAFRVPVHVHYSLAPDTRQDYVAISDFISQLELAFNTVANWAIINPEVGEFQKQSDVNQKALVGVYKGSLTFICGTECL